MSAVKKVAVVTGASRGIGAATAKAYRERGGLEPLEAEHRTDPRLHAPLVLLNALFGYFDDRSFKSAASSPSAFISRTARCDAA